MSKIDITVVIPVKNEAKNLSHCLSKLNSFSQIIVVDSKSTDETQSIAKEYNTEIINFEWNGQFPKKRNWTLRNVTIRNEWVLFLDADEFLTEAIIKEIASTIKDTEHSGFWIKYNNFFMGKEIKHGDKMKKLALFKKSKGEYEKIQEESWSHLDMEVHEHPVISGSIGSLRESIIHKDFNGLEHYINKHNAYSTWEARRYVQLTGSSNLTKRQKFKYRLIKFGLLPSVYFVGTYFLKFGFLDGKEGYYLAKYKSTYFFQIQTKIKELKR